MTEYTEQEIESWFVEYMNKNEDIEITLQQLSIDLREFESTLFDIKTKQEVIVSPMHDYIENWLKLALIKITKDNQNWTPGHRCEYMSLRYYRIVMGSKVEVQKPDDEITIAYN
jgi:hypothetical protein